MESIPELGRTIRDVSDADRIRVSDEAAIRGSIDSPMTGIVAHRVVHVLVRFSI